MKSTTFASLAFAAGVVAESIGSAVVINKCNYDVYMYNTPSADGGYSDIEKVLSKDETYTQKYTELSNGNGWSIKLSNSTDLTEILQYEYTFHADGIIWYDLSAVNGNPWDGNWEIVADSPTCVPRQAAYRYATDDAYGMQSCPDDSTITVTICSGESQNDEGAAEASSSVASATKVSATKTAASATFSTAVVTSAPASSGSSDEVVVTVTKVATATSWSHSWGSGSKRDRNHGHAARHPHGRN